MEVAVTPEIVPQIGESPALLGNYTVNEAMEYVSVKGNESFSGLSKDLNGVPLGSFNSFTSLFVDFKYTGTSPKPLKGPKGIRREPVLVKSNVKYNYKPTSLSRLYR